MLKRERKGEYLEKIQCHPTYHLNRNKEFIFDDVAKEDFVICEIGGTVGIIIKFVIKRLDNFQMR